MGVPKASAARRDQLAKENGRMGENEYHDICEKAGMNRATASGMDWESGPFEVVVEMLRRDGKAPAATPAQMEQLRQCRKDVEVSLKGAKLMRDGALESGNIKSAQSSNREVARLENAMLVLNSVEGLETSEVA